MITRKCERVETEKGKEKSKSKSVQYFLIVNNQRIRVCERVFIKVLHIFEKRVRWSIFLLENNTTPFNKRGKHTKSNACKLEYCQKIHGHSMGFPT
jgi:hypothetical protein